MAPARTPVKSPRYYSAAMEVTRARSQWCPVLPQIAAPGSESRLRHFTGKGSSLCHALCEPGRGSQFQGHREHVLG
jgi:hypothetical protein